MPTSIHLPRPLLIAVDRRAKALRISRNRLICKALERELAEGTEWSSGFFDELRSVDGTITVAVDELVADVRARRRSKKPLRL